MSYQFRPDRMYRMPTHFGPSLGPRQGIEGRRYLNRDHPKQTTIEATFEAKPAELAGLLPPMFEPLEPSRITFAFTYIREIEWLAGRGYNTFGVRFPARFRGRQDDVSGEFLAVLWENRTEPIITGREELGFAKIYCELPDPQFDRDPLRCEARWEATTFAALTLEGRRAGAPATSAPPESVGLLHYKYIPATEAWGKADVEYAVLTPAAVPNQRVERQERAANASMEFCSASWEALPTLYNVVSVLAGLWIGPCVAAGVTECRGSKDISDQRRLT